MVKASFGFPVVLVLCLGVFLVGCSRKEAIGLPEPPEIGAAASGPFRFPLQVRHPGFPGRRWTPTIKKKREKPFQRNVQKANNRSVNRLYR